MVLEGKGRGVTGTPMADQVGTSPFHEVLAPLAAEIVLAGARLASGGLVAGTDGNVSARLPGGMVLVTPAGAAKGELSAGALVVVDMAGRVVEGDGVPSTELPLHLALYEARPDVDAIVHAHPPTATGFALAGEDFMAPVLPEIILGLGGVPLVPYATPGSQLLANSVAAAAVGHDALLLANHGAVATGSTVRQALWRMECLEHAARTILTARLLGRVTHLDPEQTRALYAMRDRARGGDVASTVHTQFVREEA